MKVGVLAVQGAFDKHAEALREVGCEVTLLRQARDVSEGLTGLVFPGGESTVQFDLIQRLGLERPLLELVSRVPVLATCAGMILLSKYGALDVDVERNAWGRQIASFEARTDRGRYAIFIRAPRITRVGDGVEVLDTYQGEPVLVRERNIVAATFHPELGSERELYRAFTPASSEAASSFGRRLAPSHPQSAICRS